jgi:hypothetical protein
MSPQAPDSGDNDAVPESVSPAADASRRTDADVWAELRLQRGQLREGARTFGELRTWRALIDDKLRQLEIDGIKLQAESKMELSTEIRRMSDEVSPRATPLRIAGWIAAFITVVGSPIGSAIYFSGSAPSRAEIREIDGRVRALEMRVAEIQVRLVAKP